MKVVLKTTCVVILAIGGSAQADVSFSFDAPVPGTIADANGLGTGFTHRLPGTGGGLPSNDPNLDLLGTSGRLLLTSTQADLNQSPGPGGANLGMFEAPGVLLENVLNRDLSITAIFRNVSVPNASDQLGVYVGTSEVNVLRAVAHELNTYVFSENTGGGDLNTVAPLNAFTTGDDLELSLARAGGEWTFSWRNLTNPLADGALPGKVLPWLNSENDLHVGVLAANAGGATSFTAEIDSFDAVIVPEPSTWVLVIGAVFTRLVVWRRRGWKAARRLRWTSLVRLV